MVCWIPYFVKGAFNMSIFSLSHTNNENKNYSKYLKKIRETSEYKKNKLQIDCIKKVLIEHAEVPGEIIDLLIETIEKNISMEYDFFRKSY